MRLLSPTVPRAPDPPSPPPLPAAATYQLDLVGYTSLSDRLGPAATAGLVASLFTELDRAAQRVAPVRGGHGGRGWMRLHDSVGGGDALHAPRDKALPMKG
jgi:hypothetical protein